jgi:hypothetical protein
LVAKQPVLIIGMHRSGTSMLTSLLEGLGLFFGWRKEGNHEAIFFQGLNDWLLSQAGGAWDHPEPIRHLLAHDDARALVHDYLEFSVRAPRAASFLGPVRYLRHRTPAALPFPWGWKDPRTTFTLPLWLDLYPGARVLHVRRHGVDVADSLERRQRSYLHQQRERYFRLRPTYALRSKRAGFTVGLRCASLGEGFDLWETYLREGRAQVRARGPLGLEVKYEDFLAEPERSLLEVAGFCGLEPSRERCAALVEGVRADRAYSYRTTPELAAFADTVKERLAEFGY